MPALLYLTSFLLAASSDAGWSFSRAAGNQLTPCTLAPPFELHAQNWKIELELHPKTRRRTGRKCIVDSKKQIVSCGGMFGKGLESYWFEEENQCQMERYKRLGADKVGK